jgi:uncharacterized protein (TIGR03067 family)
VFQENEMITRVLALALMCAIGFVGLAQEKPKEDAQLLQGSWDWDPAAKQSDAEPVVLLERIVIKGDSLKFHYSLDGKKFVTATEYKIDPTKSPKQINFAPTDKDNAGKGLTYFGLYELKDGQLKICYRGPGSTRPKSFNDKADGNNGTTFITLKPSPGA